MTPTACQVQTVLPNSWWCSLRATLLLLLLTGTSFSLAAGELPRGTGIVLAEEPVIVLVRLHNGRVLRAGRVEVLTASRELELISTARGIRITRRVPLEQVAAVMAGGRTVRFDEARPATNSSGASEDQPSDWPEEPVEAGAVVSSGNSAWRNVVTQAGGREEAAAEERPPAAALSVPSVVSEFRSPAPLPRQRPARAVPPGTPAGGGHTWSGEFASPGPGRVIGVRPGPLTAYADLAAVLYPFGVPAVETAAVLELLRAARARQVFGAATGLPGASLWPGVSSEWRGPADVAPQDFPLPAPGPAPAPVPGPEAHLPAPQGLRLLATASPVAARGGNEIDSLEVVVRLVDGRGAALPFAGTLSMRLHGLEVRPVRGFGETVDLVPERERLLATRTAMIRGTARGTVNVARLPLTDPLPAHDSSVAPAGDLHLELTVPGRGVFATTVPEIPLAGTSRLQQWRQLTSGSRFAADQRTSGSRLQAGSVYRGRFVRGSTLVPAGSLGPPGRVFTVQP